MNLVADESVDGQIVARLRQDGHAVTYIAEMAPGTPDDAVLRLSTSAGAVLLTADKDFGELVFRQRRVHSGVILVRLAGLTPDRKAEVVAAAVREHGAEFGGAFVVVTPRAIRIRRPTA